MNWSTPRAAGKVRQPVSNQLSRRGFFAGTAWAASALGALAASATRAESAAIMSSPAGVEFDYVPVFNPQAKYKAVFAHDSGPRSCLDFYGKYLQTRLTTLTHGEISINVIGNAALGGADATVRNVRAGTLEFASATGAILGGMIAPEFALFDLPYLITSYSHFMRVVFGSPFLMKMHDIGLSRGVKLLTPFNGGLRHIFYKGTKAVLRPADLKGMKLRTMPAPLDVAMWNLAGAQATPLSYAEVYNALQHGVVDGLDNVFSSATSIRLDEVVKNVSLTAHRYQVNFPIVSVKWFNGLPKEYQDYVLQAAAEGSIYSIGNTVMEEEGRLPTLWTRAGIKVHMPDRKAFAEAMSKVYADFAHKMGGDEAVEAVRRLQ